jgi:hypothetical protein
MYGVCEGQDGLGVYLVLEHAHYGSLRAVYKGMCITAHDCRNTTKMGVSLHQRAGWLRDAIEAVSYLHQDIKWENVLLGDSTVKGIHIVSRVAAGELLDGCKLPAGIYSFGMTTMDHTHLSAGI